MNRPQKTKETVCLMVPDKVVLQKVVDSLKSVGQFDVSDLAVSETSAVFKAVEQKLRRALVIKLMPVGQWGEGRAAISAMAAAERKIVRGFDHPNLPRMISGGEVDGQFFWIFDFIDGIPLRTTIEKGETLKALDLVDMARQLCASLDFTSKSGIVHHRFTPNNLIIEWDGCAKLLDWSVPPYPDLGANASPETLKSAHYLSPEQLAGENGDNRSSLFSVGAILYRLATGKVPFQGEDIASLRTAMESRPKTLIEIDRKIPPGISAPIMKLLSKDPAERYKSGPEFIKELESYKKFGQKDELPANFVMQKPAAGNGLMGSSGGGLGALETEWSQSSWTPPPVSSKPAMGSTQESSVAVAAPAHEVFSEEAAPIKETVYQETTVVAEAPKPKIQLPKIKIDPEKVGNAVAKEVKKIPPLVAVSVVGVLFIGFLIWRAVVPYLVTDRMSAPAPDPDIPITQTTQVQTPAQPAVEAPAQVQPLEAEPAVTQPAVVDSRPAAKGGKKNSRNRKAPAVVTPTLPSLGELSVSSDPEGAQFQLDGRSDSRFVTPATVGQLTPGRHSIVYSKAGYRSETLATEVVAGSRATVMIKLSHQGGTVAIGSIPAGANIFVDGRDTGKITPAQVIIPSGQHAVALKTVGYLEYNSSVTIADGQSQSLSPTLVQLGRTVEIKVKKGGLFGRRGDKDMGSVSVRTSPPGAIVSVNGQLAPKATPLEFSLNPGGYELLIELTGYKSVKRNIVVDAGAKNSVDVTLDQQQ
jgi:serine/threonine protein kinase